MAVLSVYVDTEIISSILSHIADVNFRWKIFDFPASHSLRAAWLELKLCVHYLDIHIGTCVCLSISAVGSHFWVQRLGTTRSDEWTKCPFSLYTWYIQTFTIKTSIFGWWKLVVLVQCASVPEKLSHGLSPKMKCQFLWNIIIKAMIKWCHHSLS